MVNFGIGKLFLDHVKMMNIACSLGISVGQHGSKLSQNVAEHIHSAEHAEDGNPLFLKTLGSDITISDNMIYKIIMNLVICYGLPYCSHCGNRPIQTNGVFFIFRCFIPINTCTKGDEGCELLTMCLILYLGVLPRNQDHKHLPLSWRRPCLCRLFQTTVQLQYGISPQQGRRT